MILDTWHAHHTANHLKAARRSGANIWVSQLTISLSGPILCSSHYTHLLSGYTIDTGPRGAKRRCDAQLEDFFFCLIFSASWSLSFPLSPLFYLPLVSSPPLCLSEGLLSPAGGRSVSKDFSNCLTPWQQALKTLAYKCMLVHKQMQTHTLTNVYLHAHRNVLYT